MKKAVFLDRDGVINEVLSSRVKFVNKPSQFYLLEGVGEAISLLNLAHIPTFIVTNQGGVGLGFMKESALHNVHKKMIAELAKYGAHIEDIAYCPHKPTAGCVCRKPEAQMLIDLASAHNIDLSGSIMVGDREPDIEAGKKAGCKTVLIGDESDNFAQANIVFPHLLAAVPWILEELH
ncbi:D-glycero-alpha-D-manno-heptose-1,7-bisphosphate 7-phosphatase [Halalkalibacter okhensis]|uniref:D,D-heptose 1,7-bisphosphate phosphatase n=1 Tax=Halalkalibacter okhensis TaxID=333138 RepID=A0A0B0IEY2_9BACI|nr:HAD family hydrolase [Halalkalibacter okhensis]KHF39840.1 histidinol phosphatase [Halalkalibacter okhensis]